MKTILVWTRFQVLFHLFRAGELFETQATVGRFTFHFYCCLMKVGLFVLEKICFIVVLLGTKPAVERKPL